MSDLHKIGIRSENTVEDYRGLKTLGVNNTQLITFISTRLSVLFSVHVKVKLEIRMAKLKIRMAELKFQKSLSKEVDMIPDHQR